MFPIPLLSALPRSAPYHRLFLLCMTCHKTFNCSIATAFSIELLNKDVCLVYKLIEFLDAMLSNSRFGYQVFVLTDKRLNPSHVPIVDFTETVSD